MTKIVKKVGVRGNKIEAKLTYLDLCNIRTHLTNVRTYYTGEINRSNVNYTLDKIVAILKTTDYPIDEE